MHTTLCESTCQRSEKAVNNLGHGTPTLERVAPSRSSSESHYESAVSVKCQSGLKLEIPSHLLPCRARNSPSQTLSRSQSLSPPPASACTPRVLLLQPAVASCTGTCSCTCARSPTHPGLRPTWPTTVWASELWPDFCFLGAPPVRRHRFWKTLVHRGWSARSPHLQSPGVSFFSASPPSRCLPNCPVDPRRNYIASLFLPSTATVFLSVQFSRHHHRHTYTQTHQH